MRTICCAVVCLMVAAVALGESVTVTSPDGAIEFRLTAEESALYYDVRFEGGAVLVESPLGLALAGLPPLGPGLAVHETARSTHDATWETVVGKRRTVRDHYNALTVRFAQPQGATTSLSLAVRAYNDGVAFRYEVAGDGPLHITNELTAYRVTQDTTAFAQIAGGFNGAYESEYNAQRVSDLQDHLVGYPLLLEYENGPWLALSEANLTRYAGQFIRSASSAPLLLTTRLAPSPAKDGVAVHGTLPLVTPWRVILLGRRLGTLVESDLILNCNEPCAIADPSWIRAGKCVWDWWSDRMVSGVSFDGGINTETYLHLAEFAADNGIEYLLIDDGWALKDILTPREEVDLPRILDYCRQRGVGVLLWMTWGACNRQMDRAFPLYESWGVAGVKIDYMNADHEEMVDFYLRATQRAAQHKLLVDFHGAYKPTGIRRTWPNLMTYEGVKGEEHSKWDTVTPTHNVTLPFTRMLAGPMDYTPGGFDNWQRNAWPHVRRSTAPRVLGTRAHTLAKYVVYESPLQMLVDYPENYRGEPGFDFLRLVPATWDDTRVIDGYPGRAVALARRSGNVWYVGVMTGDGTAGRVTVPLEFLEQGRFKARIWEDGGRAETVPTQLRVSEREVSADAVLLLNAVSGGGAVARIVPEGETIAGATRLRHLVGLRWAAKANEEQKAQVLAALRALPEQIPEILKAEFGADNSGRGLHHGFENHILFTFRDAEALKRYQQHPAHQAFVQQTQGIVEDLLVLDWPVPLVEE